MKWNLLKKRDNRIENSSGIYTCSIIIIIKTSHLDKSLIIRVKNEEKKSEQLLKLIPFP